MYGNYNSGRRQFSALKRHRARTRGELTISHTIVRELISVTSIFTKNSSQTITVACSKRYVAIVLESTKPLVEKKKNCFPRTRNGEPLHAVWQLPTATVIKQILNGHFQRGHRSTLVHFVLLRRIHASNARKPMKSQTTRNPCF